MLGGATYIIILYNLHICFLSSRTGKFPVRDIRRTGNFPVRESTYPQAHTLCASVEIVGAVKSASLKYFLLGKIVSGMQQCARSKARNVWSRHGLND
jgi:hypothetical protein